MRSGATTSAGREKKAWGRAERCWEVAVAMGVAWAGMGGDYWERRHLCRIGITDARTKKKYPAAQEIKGGIGFI